MESRKSQGVSVQVRFTAAPDQLHGPSRGTSESDLLAGVRSMLDPTLVKAMVDAEPRLLKWLRASRANIVQFTMDPMTALRSALPDFDPRLLARIAAIRAAAQRTHVDVPGVTVDRFEVHVAPENKEA